MFQLLMSTVFVWRIRLKSRRNIISEFTILEVCHLTHLNLRTYAIASRLYEKMETEITTNYTCIQETTGIEERNYTSVYNLNEKVLNGTDAYTEFLIFGVRAYTKKTNSRKNVSKFLFLFPVVCFNFQFFVNVLGLFKHDVKDDYNFDKMYPYVTDTLKSGCLAGYMER